MIYIPLIYFCALFAYFLYNRRSWGMDLAATTLLIVISFCAILIDIDNIYGDYGINEDHITLPTIALFCFQWTLVLLPLNHFSNIEFDPHPPVKENIVYGLTIMVALSSLAMLATSLSAIRDALIMDLADVRDEHYKELQQGMGGEGSVLMIIPNILTNTPFPTLALFLWFYMKAFMKVNVFIRAGILIASVMQAVVAITIAGRAAMIYWLFDFFLIYSFFYRYIAFRTKLAINMMAGIIGGLAAFLFLSITIARFDSGSNNPLASLYGYAGQHIDNFCTMIIEGGDTPPTTDRIFPMATKITTGETFDMYEHYQALESHTNATVNVFDTFGGEIFLDLGWFGYIFFMIFLFIFYLGVKFGYQSLQFHHTFLLVVCITFFTHGLFAWPFTFHVTTYALILFALCFFLFKYEFRI